MKYRMEKKREGKKGGRKEKRKGRKAVSPVVATVGLIGISIALFIIVFIWSRSFVEEQILKFGKAIESYCQDVKFNVDNVQIDSGQLNFTIDNVGNVNIYQISITYYYDGNKATQVYNASSQGALAAGDVAMLSLDLPPGVSSVSKVEVYPIIAGEGKESKQMKGYLCKEQKFQYEF
jgi:FlaG/FlaF family flagellin (archaellin)